MPSRLPMACRAPGCPNRATHHGYCDQHQGMVRDARRCIDQERGSARERGYTTAWDKARAAYLRQHPLCVDCLREGKVVPATVVDHIIPHRGDRALFWDVDNWQPLCAAHHAAKTAKGE